MINKIWRSIRSQNTTTFSPENFDPFAQDFIATPYPVMAEMIQQGPFRCPNGSWIISSYSDVAQCLAEPTLSNTPSPYAVVNSRNKERYRCADVANKILPYLDAPYHTAPRKILTQQFHGQWHTSESAIKNSMQKYFPTLQCHRHGDILSDFATPVCVEVILKTLGFSNPTEADISQIKSWSEWFFYLFSIIPNETTRKELDAQLAAFHHYCKSEIINARKKNGFIATLLSNEGDIKQFPIEILTENCMLLIADACNADYAIANAVNLYLQYPKFSQGLSSPDIHLNKAADEILRFDSPSLFIARRTLSELKIGDHCIPANQGVLLMLAAANRDPRVFDNPQHLDITRQHNPYLSFGKGEHSCIGRKLVRTLISETLATLLACNAKITLTAPPQWDLRAGHRWLKSLPVKFR
ncbi:Biotin biosynthesis cytochrome P450 [Zhongshania aliphaticivorans]|uniref:Biotin biosynthesis cytochrome P450 n=1 Tax=Zhongshania aliphaticivorans TaxID=1470434 RepID=A0A5S9PRD6_9GAMM|nr:cytochrome P450 [Zhongshania aliphaticivorans]CAA0107168.1 Biotin biosynthesis cytochrome P450 [Zhongshania aliphaticivorans]CAA0107257.1 Biotin biosynthesis cytochrome P450 [Zhongshania aliphaticivorans]